MREVQAAWPHHRQLLGGTPGAARQDDTADTGAGPSLLPEEWLSQPEGQRVQWHVDVTPGQDPDNVAFRTVIDEQGPDTTNATLRLM